MSEPIALTWTRGDSGRLDVNVRVADGAPFSLVGSTLFLTVKSDLSLDDSLATLRKDITTHDDPENGASHFDLTTSDNNTVGSFFYDVQLKTSNSKIYTLFGGSWRVLPDVTSRTEPLL